jgi:hypothetical protein
MHRIERYEEEVFIEDARVTRCVYGIYKEHRVAIYLEDDDCNYFSKNCDYVYMNGYLMSIPGETYKQYGQTYTVTDEDWWRLSEPLNMWATKGQEELVKQMEELCIELYPDFVYVTKKWTAATTAQLMEALSIWKEHPDVELLLTMGFEEIAFSPAFYRLGEEKKKAYCRWILKHPDQKDICFKKLQVIICHNLSVKEWNDYCAFLNDGWYSDKYRISYPIYKYLAKQIEKDPGYSPSEIMNLYDDYKYMAGRAGHNLKEKYWKFPSHLKEAHDKVSEEVRLIEEAKRIAREKAEAEELRKNQARLKALAKKFADVCELVDGYSIFISTDYDVWQNQAKVLHQCICSGGYFQKMANGDCTIIFIQKDGVPIATAEILKTGKLNQFYADERSGTPGGSLPSAEVKAAFNKWLEAVPKSKFKARRPRKKKVAAEVAA